MTSKRNKVYCHACGRKATAARVANCNTHGCILKEGISKVIKVNFSSKNPPVTKQTFLPTPTKVVTPSEPSIEVKTDECEIGFMQAKN